MRLSFDARGSWKVRAQCAGVRRTLAAFGSLLAVCCAAPPEAAALDSSIESTPHSPMLEQEGLAAEQPSPSATPEPRHVRLDTTLDLQRLGDLEPEAARIMDDLGKRGRWLLPSRCASADSGAQPSDPTAQVLEALYAQDADGVRSAALQALESTGCRRDVVGVDEIATVWYYLGVAEVLQEHDATPYFSALKALQTQSFVAPDLGRRVREAFDAAPDSPEGAWTPLAPPPGQLIWRLDGQPLSAEAQIGQIPHLLQLKGDDDQAWSVVLMPDDAGGFGVEGAPLPEGMDLGKASVALFRADVARWLRVLAGQGAEAARQDDLEVLNEVLKPAPWQLEVVWQPTEGPARTWSAERATDPEPEAAPTPTPAELVPAELAPAEPTRGAPKEHHKVAVSASAGALNVRGATFVPLLADAAVEVVGPLRVEFGLLGGPDLGSQGDNMRAVVSARLGARFELRPDMGLTASLGVNLLTRGPDPYDPEVFLLQSFPSGWVRVRPVRFGGVEGPFVELGAGLAPGVWRSDEGAPESAGFLGWVVLGYERR